MVVLSCTRTRDRVRRQIWWLAVASLAFGLLAPRSAHAIFLDKGRNISLRAFGYTQTTLATEDSLPETDPVRKAGQVIQQRNFFEPEFEAKLVPLLGIGWLDDLSVRFAYWGFYDGVYDYGTGQYAERAADIKFRHTIQVGNQAPYQLGFQGKAYHDDAVLQNRDQRNDTRDVYGLRYRVNEAYVNIAKGPVFVRIGRQAISWGEADTIGLLDANNPFDSTLAPGLQQDLDESRIPLWTLRATVQIFDNVGPFSSGFIDTYWVPGWLDTTISPAPVSSGSPYSAPQGPASFTHVTDVRPEFSTKNSRWGARFQTVVARDYTLSAWFYTTFPTTPAVRALGIDSQHLITTTTEHRLTNVIGLSNSFYSDLANSVVRSELELFNGEPGFVVKDAVLKASNSGFTQPGSITRANILRGELGFDRNFFLQALNPANSFVWTTSFVFAANLSETKHTDYRAGGLIKPSAIRRQLDGGPQAGSVTDECDGEPKQTSPGLHGCDFVNQDVFEYFAQTHLQTDFMHGSLTPQVTTIINGHGALTWVPEVTYRISDSFISDVKWITTHTFGGVNGGFGTGVGLFRDRDQVWFRLTYQIN